MFEGLEEYEILVCTDCLLEIANGDLSSLELNDNGPTPEEHRAMMAKTGWVHIVPADDSEGQLKTGMIVIVAAEVLSAGITTKP